MFQANPADFVPIPTLPACCRSGVGFDIYIRKGSKFLLFAKQGTLGKGHARRLRIHEAIELFIHKDERDSYDEYIESNFSTLLHDDSIPLKHRSTMLYEYSLGMGKEVVQAGQRHLSTAKYRGKLEALTADTYEFLSRKANATESIAGLLSHNYRTYSHCVNVMIYTILVLVALEYGRNRAKTVGTGAILHDIGKRLIPKAVLDKPGALTEEEMAIVRTHPGHGLEICREMHLDTISQECIVQHHEKLDGSGYPYEVRQIPEHVRIVTIADIFDALTSDRPYSKACPPGEAFRIILGDAQAGKLDKGLAGEFAMILSEGRALDA